MGHTYADPAIAYVIDPVRAVEFGDDGGLVELVRLLDGTRKAGSAQKYETTMVIRAQFAQFDFDTVLWRRPRALENRFEAHRLAAFTVCHALWSRVDDELAPALKALVERVAGERLVHAVYVGVSQRLLAVAVHSSK